MDTLNENVYRVGIQKRNLLAEHLRSTYKGRLKWWEFRAMADVMILSKEGHIIGEWGSVAWEREEETKHLLYEWNCV